MYIFQLFKMNVYVCSVSGETELILTDTADSLEDLHAAFAGAVWIDKSTSSLPWHYIYAHSNYLDLVLNKDRWVQSLTVIFRFWAQDPFFE